MMEQFAPVVVRLAGRYVAPAFGRPRAARPHDGDCQNILLTTCLTGSSQDSFVAARAQGSLAALDMLRRGKPMAGALAMQEVLLCSGIARSHGFLARPADRSRSA